MSFSTKLLSFSRPLVRVPVRNHVGYMPFEGPLTSQEIPKIKLNNALKAINLKPVTRVHFQIDPLHPKIKSARETIFFLSTEKVRATNIKCIYKTEVMTDRSEPTARFHLDDGRSLLFKLANLSVLEVVTIMNKHVLPLVKEEKVTILETKGAGRIASGAGKKKK